MRALVALTVIIVSSALASRYRPRFRPSGIALRRQTSQQALGRRYPPQSHGRQGAPTVADDVCRMGTLVSVRRSPRSPPVIDCRRSLGGGP